MSWLRALAAALLSILFPGAGHALLREWVRAILFATLFLTAVLVFMPLEAVADAATTGEVLDIATAEMSTVDQFLLSFIVVFAAVDASFRALNLSPSGATDGDGPSCPECGRELDEDLEFCHWCTARLEGGQPADEP